VLLYRGYPIEQLAQHCDFLETCYLLLKGELPIEEQKRAFDENITRHTMVHEQLVRFFSGFDAMRIRWLLWSVWSARCPRSITTRSTSTIPSIARSRDPAAGEGADHRRHVLQVQHGAAVHVSQEQAQLRGELPPHDVRHPGR
jgi:hypothetical protein